MVPMIVTAMVLSSFSRILSASLAETEAHPPRIKNESAHRFDQLEIAACMSPYRAFPHPKDLVLRTPLPTFRPTYAAASRLLVRDV